MLYTNGSRRILVNKVAVRIVCNAVYLSKIMHVIVPSMYKTKFIASTLAKLLSALDLR